MTLLILVSCCPALGPSSPRPELGLGKDTVAVLLEGQLPGHHGVEDDAPASTGSSGRVPIPGPGPVGCWGWGGTQAPQVGLFPAVLPVHEDLGCCVGHGAAEGAQQPTLSTDWMAKPKSTGRGKGKVCGSGAPHPWTGVRGRWDPWLCGCRRPGGDAVWPWTWADGGLPGGLKVEPGWGLVWSRTV